MVLRTALRYLAVFAGVLALLSAGAYVFVSHQYTALLGPALPTPEGQAAYAHAMQRVLTTILTLDLPLLIVFALASWRFAHLAIQPIVVARERERRFAADAAHALRSPLATIAATAQAARTGTDAGTASAFEIISRAALDASGTVGELLTLARSASNDSIEREAIDLDAVANDVSREFEASAAERGVSLEVSRSPAIIQADERRIRELTRNLLENALRHASRNVKLSVSKDGSAAELCVWNDGEPIAEVDKGRIFDRFYTGDSGAGGSGLGLAIVQWIAHAHGGDVVLNRNPATPGTEFVVRFPESA